MVTYFSILIILYRTLLKIAFRTLWFIFAFEFKITIIHYPIGGPKGRLTNFESGRLFYFYLNTWKRYELITPLS